MGISEIDTLIEDFAEGFLKKVPPLSRAWIEIASSSDHKSYLHFLSGSGILIHISPKKSTNDIFI